MERRRFAQIAQALAAVTGRRTVLKGLGSLAALLPANMTAGTADVSAASPGLPQGSQPDAISAAVSHGDPAAGLGAPSKQRKLIIAIRVYPYGKRLR